MSASGNGSRRYEVHGSAAIAAAIRRLHRRAELEGRGQALTLALGEIIRRL